MIVHQVEYQAKHCEHHEFQHDENHKVPIEPREIEEKNISLKNRQIIRYAIYIIHHHLSVIGSSLVIIEYL